MDEHAAAAEPRPVRASRGAGVDIGGFFGDCDGELLARWTEFGVFQPFCRNHSAMGTARQEPWAFGEPWETICRDMLRLRMRLLPYLYTLFEECHRDRRAGPAAAAVRVPGGPRRLHGRRQFMLGSALLVAPITRPGSSTATSTCPPAPGRTGGPASASRAPRTSWRTRRWASPRCTSAATRRSRSATRSSTPASAPGLTWHVFVDPARLRLALRRRGRRLRAVCLGEPRMWRAATDGRVRFSLSAREGEFVPSRAVTRVQLGSAWLRCPSPGRLVVIERLVDL